LPLFRRYIIGLVMTLGFVARLELPMTRARLASREYGEAKVVGVRRQFSREDHSWSRTIEQLDRVSQAMNPLLLIIAVSLVVLNLTCVVNLIDWRDLPQPPAASATAVPTVANPAPGASRPLIANPTNQR